MCLVHPPTDVADRVDPSAQEATREAAETRRHLGRPNVGCACSAHTCSAALRLVGPPRPSWAIRRQPHSLVRCPQLWGQAVEVAPGRSSHATPSMGWRRRRPWRTQLPTSGAHLPRRKGASETLRSHPHLPQLKRMALVSARLLTTLTPRQPNAPTFAPISPTMSCRSSVATGAVGVPANGFLTGAEAASTRQPRQGPRATSRHGTR